MSFRICVIEGDGIGREVIPVVVHLLKQLEPTLVFESAAAGYDCFQKEGTALPEETLALAKSCNAILFGATASPAGGEKGYRSPILELRQQLDLFANLRPQYSLPIPSSQENINLLVVRENTEGLYVRRERAEKDYVIAERIISRKASERIMRVACEQAMVRKKQVTIIHKANVLTLSDGLFRSVALEVAQEFPALTIEEMLVDTAALQLVQRPSQFDVLVTTNLYGDILSDLSAGLVGGLGIAASANIGTQYGLFEPVHGSAPDIAGKGHANPLASVYAGALMLEFLGLGNSAERIRKAIKAILQRGYFSPDLGGFYKTNEIQEALLEHLFASSPC